MHRQPHDSDERCPGVSCSAMRGSRAAWHAKPGQPVVSQGHWIIQPSNLEAVRRRPPFIGGRQLNLPLHFFAARALVLERSTEDRETGPARMLDHGRFRRISLLQGSRPWNTRTEYSGASTAAPISSSQQASKSSSSTRNSPTTLSAASSARPSEQVEG